MSKSASWAIGLLVVVAGLVVPVGASTSTAAPGTPAAAATRGVATATASAARLGRRDTVPVPARQVSAGGEHSCAVSTSRTLWCWGRNANGQLGLDRSGPYAVPPTQVGRSASWRQVSAGGAHTCGVKTSGALLCWGASHRGQLGRGNTKGIDEPRRVGRSKAWSRVEAGYFHTCALTTRGRLWCWGANSAGQLGDGTTRERRKPVRVRGTWRDVAVGGWHTCAIRSDRALRCWGRNTFGQLGTGSFSGRSKPAAVSGSTRWRSVDTSWTHTCGVTTAGGTLCWGRNLEGQLGDGTTRVSAAPRAVLNRPAAVDVVVNEGSSCLRDTSSQMWCWGTNRYGAFGASSPAAARKATRSSGTIAGLSGGWLHSCGLSGTQVQCWGNNERGQTGTPPTGAAPPPRMRPGKAPAQRRRSAFSFGLASMNVLGHGHSRPYADADHFAPSRVRAEWTLEAAEQLGVDVLGMQEPNADQLAAIRAAGDGRWAVYPTPEAGDLAVESPVAWRTDVWTAVETTTFRTQFIRRKLARPVVRLRHRATGREIYVVNVHNAPWDYQAKRNAAVKVQLQKIRELEATGLPVFFVGDMNEKKTILCKVLKRTGLDSPAGGRITSAGTCKTPRTMRVDWIFGSRAVTWEGFQNAKSSLTSIVTDHWVPVVRVHVP